MKNTFTIKSKFCLTPNNCYHVESELPIWFIIVFTGATIFLAKEIYNSIK